jgi:hypothetical protein
MSAAEPEPPRVQRVTLAVREPAPHLLDAAAALARDLQAQLAALFVEDLTLLRVAALPVTREIGGVSGVSRAFDLADLERMLRWQAQQLHEQLASAARAASLAWSFDVRRGDLLEQALELLAPEQAVVLGRRRATAGRARPEERSGVTVVLDAAQGDLCALHIALRVAHGGSVSVLLTGRHADLPALRVRIEREIGSPTAGGKIELTVEGPRALLTRSDPASRGRTLVLSGAVARSDPRTLKALVDAADGLLILVG